MRSYAQVLTAYSSDTPGTTVVVHLDEQRYVFGRFAEGTQRAFVQRKARMNKVEDVFLTGRTEWASIGGLVGFLLTMGDQRQSGKPITVHGGENLLHALAATRSFVFRGQLKLEVDEIEEAAKPKIFKDQNVTVKTLHIKPTKGDSADLVTKKRSAQEMQSPQERMKVLRNVFDHMFASQRNVNKAEGELEEVDPLVTEEREGKRSRNSSQENLPTAAEGQQPDHQQRSLASARAVGLERLPVSTPSNVALSYILKMHDHRGKFLVQKAKELGVEPGRNFGWLTSGRTVTTASGRVVHPHEVMEPTVLGTGVAICDLPDPDYVADFVFHREWSDTEEVQKVVGAFFYILGRGVAHHPDLVKFMERFPGSKHIIAAPDVCPDSIHLQGAGAISARLSLLDPVFFPSLHSSTVPEVPPPNSAMASEFGLMFQIQPTWELIRSQVEEPFDAQAALHKGEPGINFISVALETRKSLSSNPPEKEDFPGSDVEVYTLGTGSAAPSKYRNVSCTLVTIPGNCSILLDCGEGTVGQMKRVMGPEEFARRVMDVRALYISHLHADHHLGSISFLKEQRQLLRVSGQPDRPTYIVAPLRFWHWLTDFSSVEDFGLNNLVFVPNEGLRRNGVFTPPHAYSRLLDDLKLVRWETAPAFHCQSSFTTAVTFENDFKLAYSGDTRPTRSFVDIGRNATLLVHEATFDDELVEEAIAKKHSTINEAIKAGKNMGARKTALVHFSQRYPKAPTFGPDDAADVVYGFDYMRFRVGDVARFKRIVPGLAKAWGTGEGEEDEEHVVE
ncbi:beta-lactamase-like protein [Sphaerosporella brunnea]|uniref:ribonuclease Z n=1 Tax=Sphaerosporella brunnea TaxID=1250544 RepID=A0A5J5EZW9_9PEZI|nr:beta-lactamase-like protein [Sphaerosporella brunnea]